MRPSADRLREFVTVVDQGSISSAARFLELPRATLSRRLTGLEADLGTRLVRRTTRSLTLTQGGQELYQRARRVIEDIDETWSAVEQLDDQPRGLLRVSMPPIGSEYSPLFLDFLKDFPEVQLEVTTTTRHVDLVAEGVDVALRFGKVRDENLIGRRLWTSRTLAVASPAYLDARGRPGRPEDLADHTCLLGFSGDWRPAHGWPLWEGGQVPVQGRLVSNSLELLLDATLDGQGIAVLPQAFAEPHLAVGALESVLPDVIGQHATGMIVYPEREFMPPRVRVFVDRLVAWFETHSLLPTGPTP